jgi:Raf kinase inhibitor-like YbhB/YbcL family protein
MTTFSLTAACGLVFATVIGAVSLAQTPGEQGGPPVLASKLAVARGGVRLLVTSDAFVAGQALNDKYTQNGENMSPPINWTKGPAGTQSYVVLAEDSGVNRHDPIVHWVVYDIPSNMTRLPENLATTAKPDIGVMQGLNVRNAAGFIGPKPPAGQTHPYHFEVFALNARLNLDPAMADRNAVVNAMKGHVVAEGDLVTNYTGK